MKNKEFLKYLEVFQICDSTFPIGTFNHSFGMENYLSEYRIVNSLEFRTWIKNYYKSQFLYGEGLLILLTYNSIENKDIEELKNLDKIVSSSIISSEIRNATHLISKQMLRLLRRLYEKNIFYLKEYSSWIHSKEILGNPAILFTLFTNSRGIPDNEAFLMYGYSVASTLVQNAVRSIPLGQNEGQEILHDLLILLEELIDKAKKLDISYLGANMPGIELAQIRHETQEVRLFMS